jgi:hypothetical protein
MVVIRAWQSSQCWLIFNHKYYNQYEMKNVQGFLPTGRSILLQAQHRLDNHRNWNLFPNQKNSQIRVCVQTGSSDNTVSFTKME